ncbi:hypothetical protein D3C78_1095380 [compost metagenome]
MVFRIWSTTLSGAKSSRGTLFSRTTFPSRSTRTASKSLTRISIPIAKPACLLNKSKVGLRPPLDSPGPISVTRWLSISSATSEETVALLSPISAEMSARDKGWRCRIVSRTIVLFIFLINCWSPVIFIIYPPNGYHSVTSYHRK